MKVLVKVGLLVAACFAFAALQGARETTATNSAAKAPVSFDPQKAYDDGVALEALWKRAKAPGGPYPPQPSYVDKVDLALTEIPLDWPKANEATALVTRLRAERPAIEKAYLAAEKTQAIKQAADREVRLLDMRRNAAKTMETTFLDGGRDVYVTTEGKDLRTLRIRYILMSRPTVHAIQKNSDLLAKWREFGFREVVLTDGHRETWNMKLN